MTASIIIKDTRAGGVEMMGLCKWPTLILDLCGVQLNPFKAAVSLASHLPR